MPCCRSGLHSISTHRNTYSIYQALSTPCKPCTIRLRTTCVSAWESEVELNLCGIASSEPILSEAASIIMSSSKTSSTSISPLSWRGGAAALGVNCNVPDSALTFSSVPGLHTAIVAHSHEWWAGVALSARGVASMSPLSLQLMLHPWADTSVLSSVDFYNNLQYFNVNHEVAEAWYPPPILHRSFCCPLH